jgi:hypothetical protein
MLLTIVGSGLAFSRSLRSAANAAAGIDLTDSGHHAAVGRNSQA